MQKIDELALAMINYNHGDPKRIQHSTKVYAYAALIASMEGVDESTCFIIESAALLHDVGIRESERKYGFQNGKLQEKEGPEMALQLLKQVGGYTESQIERICWLIGHHHTYHLSNDIDYQILIEADFLVNLYEEGESEHAIRVVKKNIFRTTGGRQLLEAMYGLDDEKSKGEC